jgi:hypothetical protein
VGGVTSKARSPVRPFARGQGHRSVCELEARALLAAMAPPVIGARVRYVPPRGTIVGSASTSICSPQPYDCGVVVHANEDRVFVSFPSYRDGFSLWAGKADDLQLLGDDQADHRLRNMYALRDEASDKVTLIADDGTACTAHYCVLEACSDVFVRVLRSDFREGKERTMSFPGVSGVALERFVEGIYLGRVYSYPAFVDSLKSEELERLIDVASLADQYMITDFAAHAAERLKMLLYRCAAIDDLATFQQLWRAAQLRGLAWLENAALRMIFTTERGVPWDIRAHGGNLTNCWGARIRVAYNDGDIGSHLQQVLAPLWTSKRRRVGD